MAIIQNEKTFRMDKVKEDEFNAALCRTTYGENSEHFVLI